MRKQRIRTERRVRIVGKSGETRGLMMTVTDMETGAALEGIQRMVIVLDAYDQNMVDVSSVHVAGSTDGRDLTVGELDVTAFLASPDGSVISSDDEPVVTTNQGIPIVMNNQGMPSVEGIEFSPSFTSVTEID